MHSEDRGKGEEQDDILSGINHRYITNKGGDQRSLITASDG